MKPFKGLRTFKGLKQQNSACLCHFQAQTNSKLWLVFKANLKIISFDCAKIENQKKNVAYISLYCSNTLLQILSWTVKNFSLNTTNVIFSLPHVISSNFLAFQWSGSSWSVKIERRKKLKVINNRKYLTKKKNFTWKRDSPIESNNEISNKMRICVRERVRYFLRFQLHMWVLIIDLNSQTYYIQCACKKSKNFHNFQM